MKTTILITLAVLIFMILANSCTLRVDPDGTRTWGTDPETAAQILIHAAK